MGRDKKKDDKYFHCSQEHEKDYVAGLYEDRDGVYDFLVEKCESGDIHYSTHMEVYQMIEEDLEYPVPGGE